MYKYLRKIWKQPKENLGDIWKERLMQWREEPTTLRIERPTRLDRARSLGYKAKQGVIMVRQRVSRTRRMRPSDRGGRRPKAFRLKKITKINYQHIAEMRVNKKYPNLEVLNSYWVAEDGKSKWYEIIMLDPQHPVIKKDKALLGVASQRGRADRGLTSAGRKSRGLRNKGKGAEKVRPSLGAHKGLAK